MLVTQQNISILLNGYLEKLLKESIIMKVLIKNTADIALTLSINSLLESGLIEQLIVAIVITLFNTCIIPLFKN